MLKSLKIKNFRCFEEFDLPQLGRVNLLVGKNNGGKTSILEALHILNSPDSIKSFLDIIDCREHVSNKRDDRDIFDVNHLFYGQKVEDKSFLEISGLNDQNESINFSSVASNSLMQPRRNSMSLKENRYIKVVNTDITQSLGMSYVLEWQIIGGEKFSIYVAPNIPTHQIVNNLEETESSELVSIGSLDMNKIIEYFNEIVLTPQEEILYQSLRIIEPGIERIAPIINQGRQKYINNDNSSFVVSINKQRVPIGSMGYGIWRMLEITLAMVNIPGGTLLIDEIDTGLHFSVMLDLWKLICKTAEKLDIQVFATTHNSDCWKSLAEVANSDDIVSDDITIHRIERGKKTSIVFNEREMAIAAERDIEVR